MAKKSDGFNLSETIRDYRKNHRSASAKDALAAIKKAHSNQKINEGTFKSTFYTSGGKRKVVRRRKPGRVVATGSNHAESLLKVGLHFIRLAGGVENARERLVGLEQLIETAKEVD